MADDTRERVLAAAGPIFAREGFDGARIREICAAAEVNLASVNYHFGSKETLYVETVRLAHEQKVRSVPLPELPPQAAPEEKLHGFIRVLLSRLLGEDGGGWQTELLIREMIRPTHACKPLVEDYIRPHFKLLLKIVDEFVPAETAKSERQQLAFSIVGQCLHYRVAGGFVSLLIDAGSRSAMRDVEHLADQITRFCVAALNHWPQEAGSSRTRRRSALRRRRRSPTAAN